MKRILALALAVVFVLGFAAVAMAAHLEVTGDGSGLVFNGEYKFRAQSMDNITDQTPDTDDRWNAMSQRMRFIIKAVVGDDVTAVTRFTVSQGDFDGATQTGGNPVTDWAYLQVKKYGGTWFIGRQAASWGNKLHAWGAIKDRIKYVAKVSDALTLGGVIQKDAENLNPTGGGDTDTYYVLAVIKPVEDHKIGIIMAETNNNTTAAVDDDSSWLDIAYNGKAGPVSIAAEFSSVSRDVPNSDTSAFFIAGMMDVNDMIGVSLAYAQANDGFVADNDFSPTLMAGTEASANAFIEFGETAAGQDNKATGIVLGATFKVSDDLKLGANLAQHTLDDLNEVDMFEVDLYADYKLATNTMLTAGYAMGTLDVPGASPDDITTAAVQIKTTW